MEGMNPIAAPERTRQGIARLGDVGHSLPRASPEDRTAIRGPRLEPVSLGKKGSVSTNEVLHHHKRKTAMKETWSGIDVSKRWFDASWVSPQTQTEDFAKIPHARFDRTPQGVQQYLAWLERQGPASVRVLMEATGQYSIELTAWLVTQQPELAPAIVNPRQAKHFHKSLGLRNHTDKVDARSLGLMGKERRPRPYEALPEPYQKIRDLMRQRRHLVRALPEVAADLPAGAGGPGLDPRGRRRGGPGGDHGHADHGGGLSHPTLLVRDGDQLRHDRYLHGRQIS